MAPASMKQLYASVGVFCLHCALGHLLGVLPLMMQDLQEPDSEFKQTLDKESWIPSITMLMTTPSQIAAGILSDVYGRKVVIYLSMLPLIFASVLMFSATSFLQLLIAANIVVGAASAGIAVGQIYVAEAVSPKRRGATLAFNVALTAFGSCLTLTLGKFIHWRTLILFNAVLGLLGFITSVTSPESPTWYASQGRFDECRLTFFWLRDKDHEEEVGHLIAKQKETESTIASRNNHGQLRNNLKIVFGRNFVKSTLICTAAILCVEASGKLAYLAYAKDFMVSITQDKAHASYYAMGAGLADLVALSLSCFVLRIMKRRTVLFTAGFLALIVLMVFCTLAYLRSRAVIGEAYSWVILLFFLMYFFFINIGVVPAASAVQREVYPVFHRGLGVVMCGLINGLLQFGLMKVFPSWLAAYGMHGAFVLSGLTLLLALSYLFNFLPETSNLTLQDVESKLLRYEVTPRTDLHALDMNLKLVYVPCHPNARESF